jgi:hemoglobin/transferrin/lactoferrin receptor protein
MKPRLSGPLSLPLFFLLFLGSTGLSAQELVVRDAQTGAPLPRVLLISKENRASAVTNARGQASLAGFQGQARIAISKLGYRSRSLSYGQLEALDFQLALEPSLLNLDEVVVSATRWRESTREIASQVTALAPREVALQNPQTAADLLGLTDKVFIQKSQQGGGSPMIRGFATNRLLYSVDGVRMNTAIFRGGNLQNVISLDPFAIERTEVFFGPGSVIYGSDAIGGVMSFQTLQPQLATGEKPFVTGGATARMASANNERTAHADVNVGFQKWALLTSISANRFGPLRQGRHGPEDYLKSYHVQRIDSLDRPVQQDDPLRQIPSGYTQHNLMQKLRYKPTEKLDLTYAFHLSETSDYGRYDRHNRRRNGRPRYGQWDYGPQQWLMNQLTVNHRQENTFYEEASLRLAQQRFEESRIDRDFNALLQRNRIEEVLAYSANLDFTKTLGQRLELYYGAEAVLNEVNSTAFNRHIYSGTETPIGTRYPQSEWGSLGAYLTGRYQLTETFSLEGGLRYNRFDLQSRFDTAFYDFPFAQASLNNGALTGHLGWVWSPGENTRLKGHFSTGFRAPNVDDVGKVFDSQPGTVIVPNPNLSAEYAYNFELSAAQVIGERLKLDLTGYYSLLNDAMVRRPFRLAGQDSIPYDGTLSQVAALQNAAQARVYGLQGALEIKLPYDFSLQTTVNWQDGANQLLDGTETPVRHVAPLFGALRLTYRPNARLTWQVYARAQGRFEHSDLAFSERDKVASYALNEAGLPYAPAWYTLNFKLRYQLSDDISITAGLENITDQRYRPYSSGLSGPGRNLILAMRSRF